MAPLESVIRHGPLEELGVATLVAEDGTETRQYEERSRVLCLGSKTASISALASVIGTMSPSEEEYSPSSHSSSLCDSDELFPDSERETDESDEDHYPFQSAWKSAQVPDHSFPEGNAASSSFPPNLSESPDEDPELSLSAAANSIGGDHPLVTGSDMSLEPPGNPDLQDQHTVGLDFVDTEVGYSSVWRSMWLRTSTRPQDLVYSMMHLLGAHIDVDYSRSVEELIFELVDKTRFAPAWLTIGYHIPVRPDSGLIPLYPDFLPHLEPTFSFGETVVPASEIVCEKEFFCSTFDIDIKHSSVTDGHLICAIILDIDKISGHNPEELDRESLSFHEVRLNLSCQPAYAGDTNCHFKGHVGSLAVIVGDHAEPGLLGGTTDSNKPFVFFLKRKNGTWQKTGAGWLTEPLLAFNVSAKMKRRHLHVGAGSMNEEPVECNCPNAAKYRPPLNDNQDVGDLDTALGEAAANGDEQRISRLVGLGANVNAQLGTLYGTPLLAACHNQNLRIVEFLLLSKADANMPAQVYSTKLEATGLWYGTPLQLACLLGLHALACILILKGGANVNANIGHEGSALQASVRRHYNKALIQLLLEHDANTNAAGGIYGTPLMAMVPSRELAELLINGGADVNSTAGKVITGDGWLCRSALQMTCQDRNLGTFRALLQAPGANVNLQSGGSFATALQEAAYYGKSLVCEILLDNGADVNAEGGFFHNALQAAVAGLLHKRPSYVSGIGTYTVELLINRGADVNARGGYYGSALMAAEVIQVFYIHQLLLRNGSTLDRIPAFCPEPHVSGGVDIKWLPDTLHYASHLGRLEVVEVLLERVLPIDRDEDGRTALHLASAKGHVQVANALLQAGADLTVVDGSGCTPLHLAAPWGHVGVIRLLLEKAADPAMVDKKGNYVAAIAGCEGHYDAMTLFLDRIAHSHDRQLVFGKLLLALTEASCYLALQRLVNSYQFDIATVDPQGRNALLLAAQTGRLDILELLLSRHLTPDVTDRQRDGLLHYAARSSSIDMVRRALPFYTAGPTASNGWSPLHWASRNGDVSMVRLLLQSGVSETTVVTTTPPGQWTPYAIATFHQNNALISALGADAELTEDLGRLGLTMTTAVGPGQKYHDYWCKGCSLVCYVSTNFVHIALTDVKPLGHIWKPLPLCYMR
jgi:ankyrin repeat protein